MTMREETKRSVHRARKALDEQLSSSSASELHGAHAVRDVSDVVLTGIENILTPNMIKRTKACRAKYIAAVLVEQEAQARAGVFDADRLACVANHFSRSATRRAHTIGKLQSR